MKRDYCSSPLQTRNAALESKGKWEGEGKGEKKVIICQKTSSVAACTQPRSPGYSEGSQSLISQAEMTKISGELQLTAGPGAAVCYCYFLSGFLRAVNSSFTPSHRHPLHFPYLRLTTPHTLHLLLTIPSPLSAPHFFFLRSLSL